MSEKEAHVFIIWSKGLEHKQQVIADIETKFEIIQKIYTTWTKQKFSENLSRFYGENLPKNSSKEKHCGTGTFLCLIVRDNTPKYDLRETSKGVKTVNINMFDAKQLYRDWTGGGHKIHGSDNVTEAKSNIYLLYGLKYDDIVNSVKLGIIKEYKQDLIGANGWNSLDDIFEVFNALCNYVVLRNFVNIEDELNNLHPDIDVLTDNKRLIADAANGKPTYKDPKRVQHLVMVNNQKVFFDFRFNGDNYYDYKWEQDILKTRIKYKNIYVPNNINHFYSLMYHAFIHKEILIKDYIFKLISLSDKENLGYNTKAFIDFKVLDDLNAFMIANNYEFVEPRDLTVFYNIKIIERFGDKILSRERQSRENFKNFKRLIKKIIRKINPSFRR